VEIMTKTPEQELAHNAASTQEKKKTSSKSSPRVGDKRTRSTSPEVEQSKSKRTPSTKDGDASPSTPRIDEEEDEELLSKATPPMPSASTNTVDATSTTVDNPSQPSSAKADDEGKPSSRKDDDKSKKTMVKTRQSSPKPSSPNDDELVDYNESSPETKEMTELERRAQLKRDLGSSDEESGEERPCKRSPTRPSARGRSQSPSRSTRITFDEYKQLTRQRIQTYTQASSRKPARPRSRSRSGSPSRLRSPPRDDPHPRPADDCGRRLPNITNSDDDKEQLMAAVHNRTNNWPWLVYWNQTKHWKGQQYPPQRHIHRLYDCSAIRTHANDYRSLVRREADTTAQDKEFIVLFLENRFLKVKKAKANTIPSKESACQAWNGFVNNYIADPECWRERLQVARKDSTHSLAGMRNEIHRLCVVESLPCMVVQDHCETRGPNGPKMPWEVLTDGGYDGDARLTNRVTTELWTLYDKYESMLSQSKATSGVLDRSRAQGQARPRGGRDAAPTSRGRVDTRASEQDTFAVDLDFDGQEAFLPATSSRHSRPVVAAAVVDRSTRESRRATVSESSLSQSSRVNPPLSRDQAVDHEKRIATLERTVEGMLDLDLRLAESDRQHKLLLRELQQAGVRLPRFDRDRVEDDRRRK
jgi:hypothetical protein